MVARVRRVEFGLDVDGHGSVDSPHLPHTLSEHPQESQRPPDEFGTGEQAALGP